MLFSKVMCVLYCACLIVWSLVKDAVAGNCPCDVGWHHKNGTCYKFVDETKSQGDAEEACSTLGASLVQIRHMELQMYIQATATAVLSSNYWIGLEGRDIEYRYINGDKFQVSDFTWKNGEPNNGKHGCIVIDFGGNVLMDYGCNNEGTSGCICQTIRPCKDVDQNFDKDFHYNNTCIMLNNSKRLCAECNSTCNTHSGQMLHLTPDMRDVLFEKTTGTFCVGILPYKYDTFYWTDGTANNMTEAWGEGQPDTLDTCVISGDNGWDDRPCIELHKFICERPSSQFQSITTTNTYPQPPTAKQGCTCGCRRVGKLDLMNMTITEALEEAKKLKTELAVDKESLSSTIRRKTSASDDRPSATAFGYVGAIILCVVFGSVVIADLLKAVRSIIQHFES